MRRNSPTISPNPRLCFGPSAQQHHASRGSAGFTLNEVLIALGILAVGVTSIASLFPAAIILQKEAVQETLRQSNVRSAESILRAKTISAEKLFEITDNVAIFPNINDNNGSPRQSLSAIDVEFDVYALSEFDYDYDVDVDGGGAPRAIARDTDMRPNSSFGGAASYAETNSYLAFWPPEDRTFPTYIPDPANRETFVVPLIRRGAEATQYINDWSAYGVVMQSRPEENRHFPNVYSAGPAGMPVDTVCANPFDYAFTYNPGGNREFDRFPKVFRVPVQWDASRRALIVRNGSLQWRGPTSVGGVVSPEDMLIIRPGDMVLSNTGGIYRVGRLTFTGTTADGFTLNLEGRQDLDDEAGAPSIAVTDIEAVWICPPGYADGEVADSSPIRDVRVLNRNVVRIGGYE
ncbi:MAG: prepilin-type N-terminal cleavage/methylation domain-containing protein [Planctomycetota bacterium]